MYQNEMEAALSRYANEFDDLSTVERQSVIDLSAVNELSDFREIWQNTTTGPSEHHLSTSAGADERAWLETRERGQYVSGYEVQTGVGVRVPTLPQNDEVIRWGYYEADANDDPLNGFYFGIDSDGIFVAHADGGTIHKTYQDNWNGDSLDGSSGEQQNSTGATLDLSGGHIFQIEFTYYGYGPVKYSVMMDSMEEEHESSHGVVIHEETFEGRTSIQQTNLPIRQDIDNVNTSADALDVYVGGRQFSIIGQHTSNDREGAHFRDSLTGIDDTQWYPAVSVRIKDGSGVGSVDYKNVRAELFSHEVSNDNVPKLWQVRRGVTLDQASWEHPSEFGDANVDETAMEVDTTATSIADGSGNATGHYMSGGTLSSGGNQVRNIQTSGADGRITDGDIITLCFRSQPGEGTGAVNAVYFQWTEGW